MLGFTTVLVPLFGNMHLNCYRGILERAKTLVRDVCGRPRPMHVCIRVSVCAYEGYTLDNCKRSSVPAAR